ncbi:unnamed protein product [Rotaria magnacalcarata]|uniref:dolichyl-P-Man:Man5GlcNAc2-PP-dolichol alpha-1,3-mannosyltransferase n=3 Tax=Rotaria magnacalcarata TaxID=392030 RepID=A0A814IHZ8_9BILA|nr:unnamed protein product [Rotaria magnacalcarata]CAF1443132.1 unnamed protein product [Rotaria magnacalcarata]CAF1931106.1 unnamed protein product [Rotaria magnacalcarata]CAF1958004.1 unnamed protein product [Rotaria magnacalcarata]CAF2255393.1 unnamed protein product [Rotaria magnacalcarata]
MPPPQSRSSSTSNFSTRLKLLFRQCFQLSFYKDLLLNPKKSIYIMSGLFILEVFLNIFIVRIINYTEIDWKAYMQEVEGVVNGTYDYYQLKGDTGPLVYPAGFVYIYLIFYYITNFGNNVRLVQYIFVGLYLIMISAVFYIYNRNTKVPPYAYIFMCLLAYRIHSIFVLRLFNDPIAMTLLYISLAFLLRRQWTVACILYSLAVSIKMNILLMAPGLFFILLLSVGLGQTFKYIFYSGLLQLIFAVPFLLSNPTAYIVRSFDLGRQFFYIWTVNWRLIPEHIFLSRYFHLTLLLLHIIVLLYVCRYQWLKDIKKMQDIFNYHHNYILSDDTIITLMFYSNFIGICFCRSLHYQFYVWYYHMLFHLLWSTNSKDVVNLLILGLIELSWNTYPSTFVSSLILHICHGYILIKLVQSLTTQANMPKPGKKVK